MRRSRWAEIATLASNPSGGYYVPPEGGWVSEKGLQMMIRHAQTVDRFADALQMLEDAYPRCPHGLSYEDEERWASWDINDYAEPTLFTSDTICLWGFHDLPEPDPLGHSVVFCVPLMAVVVGDMLLVEVGHA